MAQISSFKYHVKKIPVNRPEKMCDRAHQLGTHCNSHSSPRKNDAECDRIREIERDKRTDSERESSPIKIQSFRSRFPFYIVCMPRELLQWMQIITPFLGFSMNEYLPCPGQNWKMQIMANELCVSFVLSISWPLSLFPCLSLSPSRSLALLHFWSPKLFLCNSFLSIPIPCYVKWLHNWQLHYHDANNSYQHIASLNVSH